MSFYQAEPMQDWKPWPLSRWHGEPAITIIKANIEAGLKALKVKAWVVEGGRRKEEETRDGLNDPGCCSAMKLMRSSVLILISSVKNEAGQQTEC